MKITRTITRKENAEVEMDFPFYGKGDHSYIMMCMDADEKPYGIKLYEYDESISIINIIYISDISEYTPCSKEEFWQSYQSVITKLSAAEIRIRQAADIAHKEWDTTEPITEEQSQFLSEADEEYDRRDMETPLGEHLDSLGEISDEGMNLI